MDESYDVVADAAERTAVTGEDALGQLRAIIEAATPRADGGWADRASTAVVTFLALAPRLGRRDAMREVATMPKPSELTVVRPAGDRSEDE